MSIRIAAGEPAMDLKSGDLGTIVTTHDGLPGANLTSNGFGAILDVISTATVEIADGIGDVWRPLKRADTGAAVTTLGAGSYPVAMTFRQIRVTAGSINIRPLIRS